MIVVHRSRPNHRRVASLRDRILGLATASAEWDFLPPLMGTWAAFTLGLGALAALFGGAGVLQLALGVLGAIWALTLGPFAIGAGWRAWKRLCLRRELRRMPRAELAAVLGPLRRDPPANSTVRRGVNTLIRDLNIAPAELTPSAPLPGGRGELASEED